MKRIVYLFFIILVSGFLTSCRKSKHDLPVVPPDNVTESKETVRGLQVDSGTEVIDMPQDVVFVQDDVNNSLKQYDPEKGTITFENVSALKDADIKVGDVLYSMPVEGVAPDGYILRVKGIRKEGNKVIYEVEEAGLADAFDFIDTQIPLALDKLEDSCITVYDPFEQDDQTERINALFSQDGIATKGVSWDFDPTLKWKQDRWELKAEKEKTTLEIVLQDNDGNYKTKFDQIRLRIKLTYDLLNEGVVRYSFDAKKLVYCVDMTPKLGVSAGVVFFKDKAEYDSGEIPSQDEKRKLLEEMEDKLIGKKVCIGQFDVPVGAASILIKPKFEVYLFFKVNLSGELEVEAGIEDLYLQAHLENVPATSMVNLLSSYVKVEQKPTFFFRVDANIDIKGTLGVGTGFSVGLPKLLADKDDVPPYAGIFYDASVNGKAKLKTVADITDMEMKTTISAEAYAETVGYAEAYAHLKKDIIFNGKLEINKTRYPEEDSGTWKWDTTFVREVPVPVPLLDIPAYRGVADPDVTLEWHVKCRENYGPYKFDVFLSEDKTVVEQSNTRAKVAQGLSEQKLSVSLSRMKTYYWRVRCTDATGREFDSDVFTFDTGNDGVVQLSDALKRYFAVNFNALDDVYFQEDGTLLRTPSNIRALEKVTSLVISDPENKFSISNIDGILMVLPSLEMLDCSFNSIQSLYLIENPKLKTLTCHDNALKELNLQYTLSLTSLSCSDNRALKELDITSCPKLETVKCDRCGLSSLDISENLKLIELFASENELDLLDISCCRNLIRLDFHAQYKERVTLRLSQRQKENFALFRPHANTDYEYVDDSPVQTGEVRNITATSASVQVTVLLDESYSARGVLYSHTDKEPNIVGGDMTSSDSKDKTFVVTLENLKPSTTYYVRGYAIDPWNNYKQAFGNVVSFTTLEAGPAPGIKIEPEEYEFGTVRIGRSVTQSFVIRNTGDVKLEFELEQSSIGPFKVEPSSGKISPGNSKTLVMTFTPEEEVEKKGIFTVLSNAPGSPHTFTVWGTGKHVGDNNITEPNAVDLGIIINRDDGSAYNLILADRNLGAYSPDEYGYYYAWGETEPKEDYIWSTYKWCNGSADTPTKYIQNSDYGIVDNKIELDPSDDVAHIKLGGKWRMPSDEEWERIRIICKWEETSRNGVKGNLVTGDNGNSIFLPWAGSLGDDNWFIGSRGYYWSSYSYSDKYSDNPFGAKLISLYHGGCERYTFDRCRGCSVRPVYEISIIPNSGDDFALPEAIDLGLPSGIKWASWNVGASAPEKFGNYYAWGEIETKSKYDWSTYKYCNGRYEVSLEYSLTKYVTGNLNGTADNKLVLDPQDDVAHVSLGGKWRMPTDEEWTELRSQCTWTWINQNGVNGQKVIGPNGKSIFLPAAGNINGSYYDIDGRFGYYWSSSLYTGSPDRAYYVGFASFLLGRNEISRSRGLSIRAVSE